MRRMRLVLIIVLIFVAAASSIEATQAQADSQYFDQTGHSITGEFYTFYYSVPDPLLLYGYPITEAFPQNDTGLTVQYFEKVRFELHLNEPPARRVQVTEVGHYLHPVDRSTAAPAGSPGCQAFTNPENDRTHLVCYSFLEFFTDHGGLARFGYPLSDMVEQGGLTVQYFERARMEWRPGLAGDSTVALSDAGWMLFYQQRENPRQLWPIEWNGAPKPPLELKARAYPGRAVTGQSGAQTIHILVLNQQGLPVQNADVSISVRLPSGIIQNLIARESTNKHGLTQVTFTYRDEPVGMARVEVVASRNGKKTTTTTSFRIWW